MVVEVIGIYYFYYFFLTDVLNSKYGNKTFVSEKSPDLPTKRGFHQEVDVLSVFECFEQPWKKTISVTRVSSNIQSVMAIFIDEIDKGGITELIDVRVSTIICCRT